MYAIGLVKYPARFEGHKATILARVLQDCDMPTGRHLLIGNNHQILINTFIDFREMMYYTMADDGTQLAIPCSAGEFQFSDKEFLV